MGRFLQRAIGPTSGLEQRERPTRVLEGPHAFKGRLRRIDVMTWLNACAIVAVACITVFCVASVGLIGYVVSGGIATVSVDTNETDFAIPVPMRILDLGLAVAGMTMPASELRAAQAELHEELREYRPVLEEIADQLHHFPEGELVRVVTEHEQVVVRHTGGKFRVEVLGPGRHITVAVPRRAMSRLVRKTLDLGGPWGHD